MLTPFSLQIMVQTGLGIYVGNQVVNFVSRMGGTLVGVALGIIGWYLGAGRGRGNPYALSAMAVSRIVFLVLASRRLARFDLLIPAFHRLHSLPVSSGSPSLLGSHRTSSCEVLRLADGL